MHTASVIALLSLATSAWAITVTQPSEGTTWGSSTTNIVSWTEVSTDPNTFAATLVQHGVFQKTLADSIDGTKGSLSVSMTLPTGSGFQVNLVKSSQDPNTILAQSAQFNITSAGGSSSVVVSTGSGTGSSTAVSSGAGSSTGPAASSTSASLATGLPNASSTSANPTATHSNAASSSFQSQGGLLGILALFGLVLV